MSADAHHCSTSPRPRRLAPCWGLALLALACDGPGETPTKTPEPAPAVEAQVCGEREGVHRLRILHINDVYRIEGLLDGRGGVARIRSLRAQLEADCDAVLLTHAGDTLYPSLISREFGGEQMIDALNLLDGDAGAFDARMFATFGNHEFDEGSCGDAAALSARVEQSEFAWLASSLVWAEAGSCSAERDPAAATGPCPSPPAAPMVASKTDNILPHAMIELAGLKVGIYSLVVDNALPDYVACIDTRFVERSHQTVGELRAAGADLVLALTHLDAADDAALLAGDGREGYARPDMVLGGHDHSAMTRDADNRELGTDARIEGSAPLVVKGDADAVRVRVLELEVRPDDGGAPQLSYTLDAVALDDSLAPDPDLQALVTGWIDRHQDWFCPDRGLDPGCLETKLVEAGVTLVAEETEIRRYETNLASWVADQMLAAFAADARPPQIALVNSGSLRLNQTVSAGTSVTRQIVEELFAYPAPLTVIEVNGAALRAALAHSVENWEAAGHWAQMSGLAFFHENRDDRSVALNPTVVSASGETSPLDDAAIYRVVVPEYLAAGNDGYWMLNRDAVKQRAKTDPAAKAVKVRTKFVAGSGSGPDLKQLVLAELGRLGAAGERFSPRLAGRICSADRQPAKVPCLAPIPSAG